MPPLLGLGSTVLLLLASSVRVEDGDTCVSSRFECMGKTFEVYPSVAEARENV